MDYRQLQDILTQDIDLLKGLRERLSDNGESLSATDKQTLREQLSGNWLRAMQSDQRYFFVQGNVHDIEKGLDEIFKVMEQLQ